ncbi:MBL fold metallo-hydrolase [uncultured Tateyamaria sp.]|uniref:MBL fold metallo-hydrolase n=1 Tax=Tateyamaria sp. 1078 TaxID=3417464 RepID=UPI0026196638|nr:MBL fold metallo-hydrolase [uncultured Tateyamaria sp.]
MPMFTRRAFGAGLLAAPAITTLSAGATLAAAHATPKAAPAMFDAPLGAYRITALFDGMAGLAKGFFSGPDQGEIDAALAAGGITGDALPAPVTAFLLQSDDRTILIDAGMGAVDILGPGFGRTFDALAALGITTDDVDTIIVTHAHPDHIGGMIGGDGAIFANAEVIISEVEFGFWGDAGMMAQAPEEAQGLFQIAQTMYASYADRVRPVADGTEVAPGITMQLVPGHTPGHAALSIDGGDQQLMMIADTIHNSVLHLALPDTRFGFDVDSAQAAASRRALLDQISADKMLVAGSHLPFPGFGRVVTSGDAYAYVPASWM